MAVMGLLPSMVASPQTFPWQAENQDNSGHQDRRSEPMYLKVNSQALWKEPPLTPVITRTAQLFVFQMFS